MVLTAGILTKITEHQDDEDTNEDGQWNTLDCQGPRGERGPIGPSGYHCWDLNENHLADKAEDINEDGVVNILDCHGEDGEDAEGTGFWELDYTPGCALADRGERPDPLGFILLILFGLIAVLVYRMKTEK